MLIFQMVLVCVQVLNAELQTKLSSFDNNSLKSFDIEIAKGVFESQINQ